MVTIGVLCARIRVEEKQLTAALAEAGAQFMPIQPAAMPMPPAFPVPLPPAPAIAGGLAGDLVIDRYKSRAVASATVRAVRLHGADVIGAGLAATGDRLAVAAALANAGVPRPACWFAPDDESALSAAEAAGYPATLLPLAYDSAGVTLYDRDTAEAVTEHRAVLGSGIEQVTLIQSGTNLDAALVIVVDGIAVAAQAAEGRILSPGALRVAEQAALALGAEIAGIEIVETASGPVAWDVAPAPDFRHAQPLGERTAAEAIAALAICRATRHNTASRTGLVAYSSEEARGDIILTA